MSGFIRTFRSFSPPAKTTLVPLSASQNNYQLHPPPPPTLHPLPPPPSRSTNQPHLCQSVPPQPPALHHFLFRFFFTSHQNTIDELLDAMATARRFIFTSAAPAWKNVGIIPCYHLRHFPRSKRMINFVDLYIKVVPFCMDIYMYVSTQVRIF